MRFDTSTRHALLPSCGDKRYLARDSWSLSAHSFIDNDVSTVLFLFFQIRNIPTSVKDELSAFSKITWLFPTSSPTSICQRKRRKTRVFQTRGPSTIWIDFMSFPFVFHFKTSIEISKTQNETSKTVRLSCVELIHQIQVGAYLLRFLSRGRFAFEDAGIHRLDVFDNQSEEFVAETEDQLRGERHRNCFATRKRKRTTCQNQIRRTTNTPAAWQKSPGCWTSGWTRRPSYPSHTVRSRCSSSAGSQSRWSWHRCTAWTCRSCSWPLRTDIYCQYPNIPSQTCFFLMSMFIHSRCNQSYIVRSQDVRQIKSWFPHYYTRFGIITLIQLFNCGKTVPWKSFALFSKSLFFLPPLAPIYSFIYLFIY